MSHTNSTIFAALVAALLATSGCGTVVPAHDAPHAVVEVTHAIQRETVQYREWDGTLDGYISVEIRPRFEGLLVRQLFSKGAFVKKGDVLFEIDQGPIEGAPYDTAPGQADLGLASEDARSRIVSPIDGIASGARAKVGDLVGGHTVLTTVATVDWIKVFFYASRQEYSSWTRRRDPAERYASNQPGSEAVFELFLENGALYEHRGRLLRAGRKPDRGTGTVALTAVFPNPRHLLRPGQSGRLRGVVDVSERTLLVPSQAVFDLQGLLHVAVVEPDNTVAFRAVQTGERVGTLRLIEEGLRPGDRVVVEGLR